MPICPSCAAENPDGFRHCGYCGAQMAAPAPERRKLATLVFCDLSGSTALGERADSEATRNLMLSYFHEMREVLERHGGTVEKFVGDAVLAVFGVPEAHEDDALRGCRAALEMQERMESLRGRIGGAGERLAVRIGVNTGEVVAGDASSRETFVTGDPVNVAARLEQAAAPGEVLIGEATHRLVRDLVESEPVPPIAARGKAEPVRAHRLVAVRATPAADRRTRVRFTGRERELELLDDAFADAGTGGCRVCTVAGEPGVGKSRLVAEFVSRLGDRARVARGTCLSYGDGITYWPIAEIVRTLAGADEDQSPGEALAHIEVLVRDAGVARRIGQLLGLVEGGATVAETAAAVHGLLRAAAADAPLVVVVDDLQWAEPTLLDLLAGLPTALPGAPVLVLCIARPELLEERPDWTVDLPLEPFDPGDVAALLADLLGQAPAGLVDRLAAVSGGNPLFAEELVAMLEDDGRLVRGEGGCSFEGDLDALALPTSVSAIVGARLDRLEPTLRATLEPAAVEGQTFHRDAVATLAGAPERAAVGENLDVLSRRDLVRPHGTGAAGETYRFKHILVRDTVYQTTAKRQRAALHEGYADWLERQAGSRAAEVEEILGYHLEQAHAYRVALGPYDDGVRALAERAADRLARAGRRAARRGDVDAASHLLGRAAALLPEHGPERPRLLVHLGEALLEAGRNAEAESTLREVLGADGVDGATRLHAAMCLGEIELQAEPTPAAVERLHRTSTSGIELLAAHDDEQALLRTCWISYLTSMITGRAAASRAALDRLQVVAVSLSHPLAGRLPGMHAMNLAWGPVPVPEALAETTQLLEAVRGNPAAEPFVLGGHAYLLAQADELDAARAALARMRNIANRLGQRIVLWASWGQNVGRTELLAGDPERAERALRPCYQALRRAGDRGFSSTIAGQLAHALTELDRPEEAAAFAAEAREAAGAADVLSQLLWRSALAKAVAAQGEHGEAGRLSAEAVALAETTEWPNVLGDALLDQARVLRLAGRETAEPLARADVVYVAKRNAAGHRRASALGARTPTTEGAT